MRRGVGLSVAVVLASAGPAGAAIITGNSLALKSSGAAGGTNWTLSENGDVGTYVQLSQAGSINFSISAAGAASGGLAPNMTLALANTKQSFQVNSTALGNYTYT